ncbi:MAG: phosphoribosylamine---glycine ligase, partial [Pseudonocardiales bacterium]|nr:phosphoribosylamine---glycine ligase [Pseudonocardiales bacterium]
ARHQLGGDRRHDPVDDVGHEVVRRPGQRAVGAHAAGVGPGVVVTGADADGVLHAGTRRRDDGAVVSAGGRVLSVVGTGADVAAARDEAYRRLAGVKLPGSHHRTDIALRAAEGKVAVPATR